MTACAEGHLMDTRLTLAYLKTSSDDEALAGWPYRAADSGHPNVAATAAATAVGASAV